jgi:hypothetical protein
MSSCGHHSLYHVDCDVGHLVCPDLGIVGALARASLNARRQGERLRVVNASCELHDLIVLAGLDGVLLGWSHRQTEEREQPLRVEKRGEADDLTV